MLVALELQHGIHHMLQNLGTGNAPFLGDMPDQQYRRCRLFRELQQQRSALTHLRNAARGRLQRFTVNGLYGVDNQQLRRNFSDMFKYLIEIGLAYNQTILIFDPDAVGTQFQLSGTLFTRHIERLHAV